MTHYHTSTNVRNLPRLELAGFASLAHLHNNNNYARIAKVTDQIKGDQRVMHYHTSTKNGYS